MQQIHTYAKKGTRNGPLMKPGVFITLEGIDGTGKSTQIRQLVRHLRKSGRQVLVTREPGGTRVGERIRAILLAASTGRLAALAELALMYAARAQHLEEVVRPALQRGEIVVSDRYNDASFAYQGFGRKLGLRTVQAFDRIICGDTQADLTIVLDLNPGQALERAQGRDARQGTSRGRFEAQGLQFYRRVRAGYLALARRAPLRVKVVRADQPVASVQNEIRAIVERLLASRTKKGKRGF